jgi:hypothetical protein
VNFNFTDGITTLVVGHVYESFVDTELNVREKGNSLWLVGSIGYLNIPKLEVFTTGNKIFGINLYTILAAADLGVTETVAAFIRVKLGTNRLPAGTPYIFTILNIEDTAIHVHRGCVVAVTSKTTHASVLPEGIASPSVGENPEELILPKVV